MYGFQVINQLRKERSHKLIIHIQYVHKYVQTKLIDLILNIKLRGGLQILKCFNSILLNLNWEI